MRLRSISRNRPWTPAEVARLREAYGRVRTCDLAAELHRSENAVGQHAGKLQLKSGRFWTAEEDATLRRLRPTHTLGQLAAVLGRSYTSVSQRIIKLDLPRYWPSYKHVYADIRALHAEGLTDADIARRLGIDRRSISGIRQLRLKLPVNVEAVKAAGRRAVESQRRTLGIRHGGDLRRYGYAKFARARGWPDHFPPRAVQILEVLAVAGRPLSRWEIAERIGWNVARSLRDKVHGQRHLLSAPVAGGSYTAFLLREGLVWYQLQCRSSGRRGIGRPPGLYALSAKALDHFIRRNKPCARTTA